MVSWQPDFCKQSMSMAIALCVVYCFLCFAGRRIMRDLKPFDLKVYAQVSPPSHPQLLLGWMIFQCYWEMELTSFLLFFVVGQWMHFVAPLDSGTWHLVPLVPLALFGPCRFSWTPFTAVACTTRCVRRLPRCTAAVPRVFGRRCLSSPRSRNLSTRSLSCCARNRSFSCIGTTISRCCSFAGMLSARFRQGESVLYCKGA